MTIRTFDVELSQAAVSSSPDSEFHKFKFETESRDPMEIELQALNLIRHAEAMRRALETIVKLSTVSAEGSPGWTGAEILTIALAATQLVDGDERHPAEQMAARIMNEPFDDDPEDEPSPFDDSEPEDAPSREPQTLAQVMEGPASPIYVWRDAEYGPCAATVEAEAVCFVFSGLNIDGRFHVNDLVGGESAKEVMQRVTIMYMSDRFEFMTGDMYGLRVELFKAAENIEADIDKQVVTIPRHQQEKST